MNLKPILDLVQRPKTSISDIEAALAELDVAAAEQDVDRLEAERRKILVSGDEADLKVIDDQIRSANYTVERTAALRTEFENRLNTMRADQEKAAFEARHKDMVRRRAASLDDHRKLHQLLSQAAETAIRIEADATALQDFNREASAIGRSELKIESVAAEINRLRYQAHGEFRESRGERPPSPGDTPSVGLVKDWLHIPGYYPPGRPLDPGKAFLGPPLLILG